MMTSDPKSLLTLDLQLSDEETFFIGMIVAHWGGLEHEIFMQTLVSFGAPDIHVSDLPKSMNNIQFTETLRLWKERVVDTCEKDQADVLQGVYDEILRLKDYRDALTHGMWDWSPGDLHKIHTIRVKKRAVIKTNFATDDLQSFALRLARLNFKVRYPGGIEDLAADRARQGFYISRKALRMMYELDQSGATLSEEPDA